jgi:hypothetical protein
MIDTYELCQLHLDTHKGVLATSGYFIVGNGGTARRTGFDRRAHRAASITCSKAACGGWGASPRQHAADRPESRGLVSAERFGIDRQKLAEAEDEIVGQLA